MQDPLNRKCISCNYYKSTNEIGIGCCKGNELAYREIIGQAFSRGAPEGPSFAVRKLGTCSHYNSIKPNPVV